jgi:hypothetical protein
MDRTLFVGGVLLAGMLAWPLSTSAQEAADDHVTFTKDVASIFQDKCQACHRDGYMAPMSLVTYGDSRPWARSIKARVVRRQMPPWHIDENVGIQHFKNDRSLTDDEIDTIVRWVDSGAAQGDPNDMPPPRKFADDDVWGFAEQFGPPDMIITSPAYTVPAVAQDAWYRPSVPTGLTETRWVRAIEIRPSTVAGRRVTHHALARLQQEEDEPGDDDIGPGLFMEWAVGKQGEIMRPNSGKLMLPGAEFVFDIHYHAVGEEITDSVELGIYFYPKGQEPKHRQVLAALGSIGGGSRAIDIPPNSKWASQNFHVMKQAGRVENFQPHMHLRGKGMLMEAILPDGTTRMLSQVSNFNFDWHVNYIYADAAAPLLPKGTVLRVSSWYDNTSSNRNNPDPNQWVGYGDRTVDEMGHAWVNITYMSEDDYAVEIAKQGADTTDEQQQ